MRYEETIWTFNTANLRVAYVVAPEDDCDLSWDDDGSVREGLNTGKFICFVACLRVIHRPTGAVLGEDYLGQCIYESADAFIDHRGCKANGYGSYFSDMVHEAVTEARKNLRKLHAIPMRGGWEFPKQA